MVSKIINLKTFLFFVVIALTVFTYKYLVSTKPEAKPIEVKEKTFYVNVISTKKKDYTPTKDAYGKVVSNRTGDLRFGVSGRIKYISDSFLNGAFVSNGQILAKLDQRRYLLEVEKLKAQTKELQNQLNIRQRQVKRFKSMLSNKVISQNKYDNELILLSKNRSDYVRSKISLEKAKEDLADTVLKSEFNGRLFNVNINKGQFISGNEKVANIFSTDNLEVEFVVPARVYSKGKDLIGKKIDVIWEGGITSLKIINAIIVRADSKTNEEDGGGKFYAKITNLNKQQEKIPVGTFVRVNYPQGDFKNVFKLPETSLYGDKIYIVEDSIAKKKKVNLVYKGSGYILVTGNLTNKDLIISTKMPEIFNNKKVIILTNWIL